MALIFIAIPIVVGVVTLRKKPEEAPVSNEPLPLLHNDFLKDNGGRQAAVAVSWNSDGQFHIAKGFFANL